MVFFIYSFYFLILFDIYFKERENDKSVALVSEFSDISEN